MIFNQSCYNINIRYFQNIMKVDIENIKNNIVKFKIYEYILQIFQLNKCNMIIKYCDIEYLIYNENDLKRIFKILINIQIFCIILVNKFSPINIKS